MWPTAKQINHRTGVISEMIRERDTLDFLLEQIRLAIANKSPSGDIERQNLIQEENHCGIEEILIVADLIKYSEGLNKQDIHPTMAKSFS